MNTKKTILVTLIITAILLSCGKDDKTPDPECDCTVKAHNAPCECGAAGTPACGCAVIQRTFTDLTFLGKNITLIDRTDGAADLKARNIHAQIQDGLNATTLNSTETTKFNAIYATGNFAIVITGGAEYDEGYSVEGYEILLHENQVVGYTSINISGVIRAAVIYDMTISN